MERKVWRKAFTVFARNFLPLVQVLIILQYYNIKKSKKKFKKYIYR